ncbi:MAG: YfhO family protein, partial [Desulfuromonadaceae bacterium]
TEQKKNLLTLTALLGLVVTFFSKILFSSKIIRAPDIINEFYWGVVDIHNSSFSKVFAIDLSSAGWDIFINSGHTADGGGAAGQFLLYLKAIFYLLPLPTNVAWSIVLQLFFGAVGMYSYCRLIGTGRFAAFLAGTIFALSPEHATLINAGHVMKIATISFAPWAFFCLEKGFLTTRIFWFMATAFMLAFQFFNTHWQIAYYTCLCVGMYGILRVVAISRIETERTRFPVPRLLGYNLVLLAFFLSTVSISLIPLANWSKDTNRGAESGANQGKGGLDREEAMSWSLPPEETAAFVIPGFFGYSRQEAGPNPDNIPSYYWGRMVFTQTLSYMGLLPWLLVPLPLIFRRDKYTWLAVIGLAGGLLFSMGKYTPFYNLLYDYFPGINRFRVPKMMMFIPVMALGVLSARGIDLLMDAEVRGGRAFRRYLAGVVTVPVVLLVFLGVLQIGRNTWIQMFIERLSQPTRYEQGLQLISQRWSNLMLETGIAAALAALYAGVIVLGSRIKARMWLVPCVLLVLYVGDVWRVNDKFIFLVDAPEKGRTTQTDIMNYLARDSNQYRTLPMDGSDPMQYVSNKIPVMYTSNAVQQRRWQEFLDNFSINSALPDILNVKYLVFSNEQYAKEKSQVGGKYYPVFQSPDGLQLVLENREVLPKAWLVPSVLYLSQPQQVLGVLQNPQFAPRRFAVVEEQPPLQLSPPESAAAPAAGNALVKRYEGDRIDIAVNNSANALLVLGEKYNQGWKATVDDTPTVIHRVNYILRGVYLAPGTHRVEFRFDPLPFKIGKYLTLGSFALFAGMLIREWRLFRKRHVPEQ